MGSIWGMLGALDCIKMAGWTKQETESDQAGVVVGSGGAGNVILRVAWQYFFVNGMKARVAGSHTVDRTMFYRDAANISCLIKSKGVCEAIGSACATGGFAYAYRCRGGRCRFCRCGGPGRIRGRGIGCSGQHAIRNAGQRKAAAQHALRSIPAATRPYQLHR